MLSHLPDLLTVITWHDQPIRRQENGVSHTRTNQISDTDHDSFWKGNWTSAVCNWLFTFGFWWKAAHIEPRSSFSFRVSASGPKEFFLMFRNWKDWLQENLAAIFVVNQRYIHIEELKLACICLEKLYKFPFINYPWISHFIWKWD